MVVALVETGADGDDRIASEVLANHCRTTLAGYKVPKRFVVVGSLQRSPAGKPDYNLLRGIALDAVSSSHPEQHEVST